MQALIYVSFKILFYFPSEQEKLTASTFSQQGFIVFNV